jgi:hypothetical protein
MTTTVMTAIDQYCCATCGVIYGLERNFANRKSEQNKSWFCPNGHSQVFIESALSRAEKAAKRAQELLDMERTRNQTLRDEKARIERQRAAAHGQVTKLRNRAKHGVCPCCKRTFSQLADHMKTQHPDFQATPEPA